MRPARRQRRSYHRSDNILESICNCNIRTVLVSLLAFWFFAVVYFVSQLSSNSVPKVHSPPALFQNDHQSGPPNNYQNDDKFSNLKDRPNLPIINDDDQAKSDHSPNINSNIKSNTDEKDITASHKREIQTITDKLSSQSHLPKEQRRIWSDIVLPELPFKQPREVHEMVKEQFKNAEWQPDVEIERRKSTAKPTKHPTPSPVAADRSRYECLYYCDSPRDRDCVLRHIQYWTKPHDKYKSDPDTMRSFLTPQPVLNEEYPVKSEGFITFKNDCGGFNNLRQAYEFIIGVSWLTQRTLVFPVTEGWYLIDWGSVQIEPPPNEQGKSNYHLFYGIDHLAEAVSVMNLTHFLLRFQDDSAVTLPEQYRVSLEDGQGTEDWDWGRRQDFKKWQNHWSLNESTAVPYGINHNVLMWPSQREVADSKQSKYGEDGEPTLDQFVGSRTKRSYFDEELGLSKKDYLHFPSCVDGEMLNYRYLGQVATAIAFADFEVEKRYKKLLRDHSHLVPAVFEIASHFISFLGLFEYTSCHIRRNDFQFKNSWVSPSKSFKHMDPFFDAATPEVIYIASDAEQGFFDGIVDEFDSIQAIYRWRDFVEPDGKLYAEFKEAVSGQLDLEVIPRKLVHLIEMVIASAGNRFFGTTSSTYSAYIRRLRGYIDAPDQEIYFHDKEKYVLKYRPTDYMIEFKDMWLDIKDFC